MSCTSKLIKHRRIAEASFQTRKNGMSWDGKLFKLFKRAKIAAVSVLWKLQIG